MRASARPPRLRLAALVAAVAVVVWAGPAVPGAEAANPARTLYKEARATEEKLRRSSSAQRSRAEWEKAVLGYRKVVARYPRSGYCDDALLAVGDLYREMARRFESDQYRSDAISAYNLVVKEYPSSSLGDDALWGIVQIERDSGQRKRLVKAGKVYLAFFPRGDKASEVKKLMQKKSPATRVPTPPPPGLARVFDLRFWSGKTSTRVVLDLEAKVKLQSDRVGNPERLWIDLVGTRLHPNLEKRTFPVGDGLLERVRIAQNRPNAVRVVLDFKGSWEHNVFYLDAPPRLVVDVKGKPAPPSRVAEAEKPSSSKPPAGKAETTPGQSAPAGASASETKVASAAKPEAAEPPPPPSPEAANLPAPEPPAANRKGTYSLARQLGLGARRIVIDPGHGGHDPGTIGRGKLQEKDLVLDVSLRLRDMIRSELGAEVIMTRSTDVFVPLEERTAIANTERADLFLSIHANGVKSSKAEGIETYYLSFARSSHAEAVAARENAISQATLKDLQSLVQKIALPAKIDESKDFATSVQESLVKGVRRTHNVRDRGVHTAPFYVLIGAEMPAVLAEIGFVTHPDTEKRLKTSSYRDAIARSLFLGVKSYLQALSRTQTRQLTQAGRRSTVLSGTPSR